MNATIANLILARIADADLPWLDKTAGLTRAITFQKGAGKAPYTWPVACTVDDPLACEESTIAELLPDDKYASIVFIEGDTYPRRVKEPGLGVKYVSRLRIVAWLNCSRLGGACNCGDLAAQNLIAAIDGKKYQEGYFTAVRHKVVGGGPARGKDIFGRYTFDEKRSQYLHYPFDFFALDVETEVRVMPGCESKLNPENADCWTGPVTTRRRHPKDFSCEELNDPDTGLTTEQREECLNCSGDGCDVCAEIAGMDWPAVKECMSGEAVAAAADDLCEECEECEPATWTLKNTKDSVLDSGSIPSGGSAKIVAPDGIVKLNGVTVAPYWNVPSNGEKNIRVVNTVGDDVGGDDTYEWWIADSAISVNGAKETSLPAERPLNIVLLDENGDPVTPTSITHDTGTLTIEVPASAPGANTLLFDFPAHADESMVFTVPAALAGTYLTMTDDGNSGTITISINGGAFVSVPASQVLGAGDTIQVKRTNTGTGGWAQYTTA